ncbi:hypothetical protein BpJC7_28690 [Weizmannia acidilactici]|uniref:Uncharacterized protein n=1 Tax=Weizmannia acidilactici TaxID=2607726 RepID=A0A5J4J9T1_9BACI|nr:hypothetical protein BpJC7_28690 [Weizmannia acidilactici]GER73857.1 hypothetical protein BpPP18_19240 [Weizmannia acidilactici]
MIAGATTIGLTIPFAAFQIWQIVKSALTPEEHRKAYYLSRRCLSFLRAALHSAIFSFIPPFFISW